MAEFSRKKDVPVLTGVMALNAKHASASISTDGVACIAGKVREVIEPQYNCNTGSDFINIFKTLYLHFSCCVKTSVGNTEMFDIKTGVRQGCILSPFLFLITIDFIMTKAMDDASFGIEWGQKRLADLDFADDISTIRQEYKK